MVCWSGLAVAAVSAEDSRALPTLLIKGEVVSLDTSDPAAPLLKVKDRYGFETPIFLTSTTTISQGQTALDASALAAGAAVEVEYNFDVNTAKRHAVSVKLPMPMPTAPPAMAEPSAQPAASAAPTEAEPSAVAPEQAMPDVEEGAEREADPVTE
jgi:hypothetical protein